MLINIISLFCLINPTNDSSVMSQSLYIYADCAVDWIISINNMYICVFITFDIFTQNIPSSWIIIGAIQEKNSVKPVITYFRSFMTRFQTFENYEHTFLSLRERTLLAAYTKWYISNYRPRLPQTGISC